MNVAALQKRRIYKKALLVAFTERVRTGQEPQRPVRHIPRKSEEQSKEGRRVESDPLTASRCDDVLLTPVPGLSTGGMAGGV